MYSFGCLLYALIHLECNKCHFTQAILTLITRSEIRLPLTARIRETRCPVLKPVPQNFAYGFQNIIKSLFQ